MLRRWLRKTDHQPLAADLFSFCLRDRPEVKAVDGLCAEEPGLAKARYRRTKTGENL
jgi:hypothetical protein